MRRVILLLVTTIGLILGTSMSAQAHSTNDWTVISGWSGLPNKQATGYMEYPVTPTYQAQGWGRVDWGNGRVEVHAGTEDLARDGSCAATQVRYEVQVNGSWTGHLHYRTTALDCNHTDGDQVISSYYRALGPVRNVTFRVCLAGADGSIADFYCAPWSW